MRELDHPVLERIRQHQEQAATLSTRLQLDDAETRQLAEILDRGFDPPPALLECLRRLADPDRAAPELTWSDTSA